MVSFGLEVAEMGNASRQAPWMSERINDCELNNREAWHEPKMILRHETGEYYLLNPL